MSSKLKLHIALLNLLITGVLFISSAHFACGQIKTCPSENLSQADSFYYKSLTLVENNKLDSSLIFLKNALSIYEHINNFVGIANAYSSFGDFYIKLNLPDSAIYFYKKAAQLKLDTENIDNLDVLYNKLASVYKANNNIEKSIEYYTKIVSLENVNWQTKRAAYRYLSEFYEQKLEYSKSLEYYKKYTQIKDTTLKTTPKIPAKEEQIQPIEKEYNKLFKIFLAVGFFVFLAITGLIIYFYREKIKSNKKLFEQNQKILEQNEEINHQSNDLKNINTELEKLSIVASKTDNAIIIANPDGIIEWINESYTRLYGFTLEELISEVGNNYVTTSSNPDAREIFNAAKNNLETQIYESDVISRNGKNFRIQTTLTPVVNDKKELIYLIAIDSDVTKLKNTENELQKLLITKDRFFSIIAHDLKNPFNNLMGISQLLVQGFDRMKPEKVKYFHKGLYEISKNGYELLINLLEWARSQKGTIDFNPIEIDLHKIGNETVSLFQNRANQKEINISSYILEKTTITADINMVKTILRNLVSNALKFTDRGGVIELSSEIIEDYVKITVRDTGIGIEPKAANSLFKLDEYISTEGTENETGTGLGLILCKEFVDKHNGSIWVESKVGFGSKFNFTLPMVK